MEPADPRLRVIHCTPDKGYLGSGVARMDSLYYTHLRRDIFDPIIVVMDEDDRPFSKDAVIPRLFLGLKDRFKKLLSVFKDADIVSFVSYPEVTPLVCEAARLSQVRVLVEIIHNIEFGQLYPNIDLTVCVSERVRARQPFQKKTKVIYNGIELNKFTFKKAASSIGKTILLEAGRRDKQVYFHLDELADDITNVNGSIEMWLAGQNQVGESSENIKFLGLRSDMSKVYQDSDILVQISKEESFGLTVVEAMASGCIPIVSEDSGVAEIVVDGVNGWVVQCHDKKNILSSIRKAVQARQETERWHALQLAARQTAEKLSIQNWVAKYEVAFLELIESKVSKVKGTSCELLPTEPLPDVYLSDALFYFNRNKKKDVAESLYTMVNSETLMTNSFSATLADVFAQIMTGAGRMDIANAIYHKLWQSGCRKLEMIMRWLQLSVEEMPVDYLMDYIVSSKPKDPELFMLLTEHLLRKERISSALTVLETGYALTKDEGLKKVHILIREKLSQLV